MSSFEFGGWLQPLPAGIAWLLLGLAAIGGLALVVFLYRHTLRDLPPITRGVLTGLRVSLLIGILIVLANPSRVERPPRHEEENARRLAVVVDRSASMQAADNRNATRLDNALRIWKRHSDEAAKNFDEVAYHRLGKRLEKAGGLEDALREGEAAGETHLWSALREALDEAPAGLVCLTDGLDTTGEDASALLEEAQRRGVPVYFVPASNRSRPAELLGIRDVKTPSRVLRRSKFTASAVLEISTASDRSVPVELWSGREKVASAELKARAGWNLLPWSAEVTAGELGRMPLEFRLGSGDSREMAASTTQVVDRTKIEVLYYQGALQWGYRFLLSALQTDPSFQVESIINPALHVRIASGTSGKPLNDLPKSADGLKRFQIVVLAHVFADQLTAAQQQALIAYAKNGGGVLFIAPDSEATARFAGTPLEEMLPVVFDATKSAVQAQESAAEKFRRSMQAMADSAGMENDIMSPGDREMEVPELLPFKVPPGATGFFKPGQPVPKFSNYAKTRRVKPAAQVLAFHPSAQTAEGKPAVLLARQQFGTGFTAAMTTDLLWRWKMSLPSDSRAVETFWQQLLLSLAPASGEGLRLVKDGTASAVNRATTLTVFGASDDKPAEIVAISPSGKRLALDPVPLAGSVQATFTPDAEGRWEVSATDAAGSLARITLQVGSEVRTQETSNMPADLEGMRRAAEATGGALIGSDFVFHNFALPTGDAPAKRIVQPLWNESWLLALLLGVYATELITRRWRKLL